MVNENNDTSGRDILQQFYHLHIHNKKIFYTYNQYQCHTCIYVQILLLHSSYLQTLCSNKIDIMNSL